MSENINHVNCSCSQKYWAKWPVVDPGFSLGVRQPQKKEYRQTITVFGSRVGAHS